MLNEICGSAVFGVESYTINVKVNFDNLVGHHLEGPPNNVAKGE